MSTKPRTEQDIINEAVKETKSWRRLNNKIELLKQKRDIIEKEIHHAEIELARICGRPKWHTRLEEKIAEALKKADNT